MMGHSRDIGQIVIRVVELQLLYGDVDGRACAVSVRGQGQVVVRKGELDSRTRDRVMGYRIKEGFNREGTSQILD